MDWMTREIVERHRRGETRNGVPNPSLETVCELVSRATASITPRVQRRAFRHTGLTLAPDGSEDLEKSGLSKNLAELLRSQKQCPVPDAEFSKRFFSRQVIRSTQPTLTKVFRVLCADAARVKVEEFQRTPVIHKMRKDQRLASNSVVI